MAKGPFLPGLFANSATRFVRATFAIQARIGNHQPLYRLAADDVLFDDFVHIGSRHSSIPDCFGINHHRWPVLALIETTRLIRPHRPFDSSLCQSGLE
jgi:hypothetical protein